MSCSDASTPPSVNKRGTVLITRAVEAFGGASVLDAIKTLRLDASGSRTAEGSTIPVTTKSYFSFPGRFRLETELGIGPVITIVSGADAWVVTLGKAEPLNATETRSAVDALRNNPIVILQRRAERTFGARWLKKTRFGTVDVDLVRVTHDGTFSDLAIDASGHIVQVAFRTTRGTTEPGTLLVNYSDFRPASGGLTYPFSTKVTFKGDEVSSSDINAVFVNPKLQDALFAPPKG